MQWCCMGEGRPLTALCDVHILGQTRRLALQVCRRGVAGARNYSSRVRAGARSTWWGRVGAPESGQRRRACMYIRRGFFVRGSYYMTKPFRKNPELAGLSDALTVIRFAYPSLPDRSTQGREETGAGARMGRAGRGVVLRLFFTIASAVKFATSPLSATTSSRLHARASY